jgi:hypothetical protein
MDLEPQLNASAKALWDLSSWDWVENHMSRQQMKALVLGVVLQSGDK